MQPTFSAIPQRLRVAKVMSDYRGDCRVHGHLIVDFNSHFSRTPENKDRPVQVTYTSLRSSCFAIRAYRDKEHIDLLPTHVVVWNESWSEAFIEPVHSIPAGDT